MRADLVDDLESAARDGSNGRRVNALLREAALALRALRDAPVVQCEYDDSEQDTRVIGMSDMCWNGQRVRLVVVGEPTEFGR